MRPEGLSRFRTGSASKIGKICFGGALSLSAPVDVSSWRILDNYAMVYLQNGRGTFADSLGTRSTLVAGDVLLLFPDVGHSYGPIAGHAWEEMFVVFNGPVFDLWQELRIFTPARPIVHLDPTSDWSQRMSQLVGGGPTRSPTEALSDVCRLQMLLADALDREGPGGVATDDEEWCNFARSRLAADPRRQAGLARIAAELGMSYDGFRKRFQRLTGQTPARYRSEVSIDQACRLILDGRLSLAQIAGELGYWDESHLSRRFSQIMGMSPRQFRQAMYAVGTRRGSSASTGAATPRR